MDSFGCDWITTIDEDNIKAHNLAIKCGFKLVGARRIRRLDNGSFESINLYKRLK